MKLQVIGHNLCAQVTAAALASTGHQVGLVVTDTVHHQALQRGRSLWKEPGLDGLLLDQIQTGRLELLDQADSVPRVVFFALEPNQMGLAQARVADLAKTPEAPCLVINQSTFPVGSCEVLQQVLNQHSSPTAAHQRAVVCLPDLLQEGAAIAAFTRSNRLLLGCDHEWAELLVREILRPFNRRRDHVKVMSPREAEFTKLAITGMLATRLSFMNDLANLADTLQVDIDQVRQGMGADERIGEHYLYPGCGFGGQSFSRDVISLADTLETSGVGSELLEEVLAINERQKEVLFRKLWCHFEGRVQGKTFAIWGAAFKPGSDRIDNAPVLRLLEALWAQGAKVRIHDPKALPALARWAGERDDLTLCQDPYEAATEAEALLLVTEWKDYWSPDFEALKNRLVQPVLLDGRNIFDPAYVRSLGFAYFGVGR